MNPVTSGCISTHYRYIRHNEELLNLCPSLNIIRAIKSRRMRCTGHVERIG
jgi:hypothetical protein